MNKKSIGGSSDSMEAQAHDEDAKGILASRDYFHSLIQDEIAGGIPADRIVLGGFSQGGAMSIFAGLTAPVKIGGIVGLSSWMLLNRTFKEYVPEGNLNKETPILMGHGDRDPLVLYRLAQQSEKRLKELGYDVAFKTYPSVPLNAVTFVFNLHANEICSGMQHSACLDELNDVEAFLQSRLAPKGN
jgi:predicted esterase